MKLKIKKLLPVVTALLLFAPASVEAQSELYPVHFNLKEVTLLDGPFKEAMLVNNRLLLEYDVDRLLTPFIRQAGLTTGKYNGWLTAHPNFENWGGSGFDLSGHVGGHYLSALALAYAANDDATVKRQMKERLEYMIAILKDCQDRYDNDQTGLYGFIGGQPINESWQALWRGDLSKIRGNWGWVPFYCQHKVLAGLRDAYLYGENETAKELFRKLADWSVNLIAKVSDNDFQDFLNCEHGGMNESLLDAYQLFGDQKYLKAAKRFSHKAMIDGMQTVNTTFLDGKHANTQVPKYIGFERIYEADATQIAYRKAAENFWQDVAANRTVCIGGNSVNEHFLSVSNSNRYIDQLDGPESCNSNNMLKLSEMLSDRTHNAMYADFYENTMWNHILTTQDPKTGGYVYFTTLRPQGYRIYSKVNQGMWCCVGTGMENHSKYGHFIYTHDGNSTLYVNLFTPSELNNAVFGIRQETLFPYITPEESASATATTTLTITKDGSYTLALRHPAWAGKEYAVTVNGTPVEMNVEEGKASYVTVNRKWKKGDKIKVMLPMSLRYEVCPNYTDYIAFKFGPILLGAKTTACTPAEAAGGSLPYEALRNEYAGAGRMDHAPGSMGTTMSLIKAPLLIGERTKVLDRVTMKDVSKLQFTIDASRDGVASYAWKTLELQPFYTIQHARYMCYWYQQTADNFAHSDMAATEAANEALMARTLDFVAPGEQQSEAGHEYNYSSDSRTGNYNSESYRDAQRGGYIQYTLYNKEGVKENLSILCRFTTADKGRKGVLTVDGVKIADIEIPATVKGAEGNGFYNVEYPIPASLLLNDDGTAKSKFVVRLSAPTTVCPGLYYLRLMKNYDNHAYRFVADDWTTGDEARVAKSRITYDMENNVIHVRQTGNNNICLMLDYNKTDYTIDKAQKFLVVKGRNLRLNDGDSYLWWLNGVNKGSQVKPTLTTSVSEEGKSFQIIAWDMTKSGLNGNISGDRPNVTIGQTIFGLTSSASDGATDIHLIAFVEDVNRDVVNGISTRTFQVNNMKDTEVYNLQGQKMNTRSEMPHGIYITNGKKQVIN